MPSTPCRWPAFRVELPDGAWRPSPRRRRQRGDRAHDASHCLKVDSDGSHWGFRNGCSFDVQFAYCLAQGGDSLTACAAGGAPGSVAAGGFGALMADKSFSENDAEHDFRWLACDGGAGEVVAHLDHADPPSGRCVRAGDCGQRNARAGTMKGNKTNDNLKTGTYPLLALIAMTAQASAARLRCRTPAALKTAAVQQELMVAGLTCNAAQRL